MAPEAWGHLHSYRHVGRRQGTHFCYLLGFLQCQFLVGCLLLFLFILGSKWDSCAQEQAWGSLPTLLPAGAKSAVLRNKFGLDLNQLELRPPVILGGEMYPLCTGWLSSPLTLCSPAGLEPEIALAQHSPVLE